MFLSVKTFVHKERVCEPNMMKPNLDESFSNHIIFDSYCLEQAFSIDNELSFVSNHIVWNTHFLRSTNIYSFCHRNLSVCRDIQRGLETKCSLKSHFTACHKHLPHCFTLVSSINDTNVYWLTIFNLKACSKT